MRWQGTEEETCFSLQGFLRWLLSPSKVVSFHGLSRKLDGGINSLQEEMEQKSSAVLEETVHLLPWPRSALLAGAEV